MVNRIIDYPATTALSATDAMVVDSQAAGTQKLEASEALWTLIDSAGAPGEIRNGFFRGKNLGSKMTDAQYASVQNGSFKGLFLGDYWDDGNEKWRIAGFNYWAGASSETTKPASTPHIAIFPDGVADNALLSTGLHSSSDTTVGYANYDYIKNTLTSKYNSLTSGVFNNKWFSIFVPLVTAANNGVEQQWNWTSARYVLPTRFEVLGIETRHSAISATPTLPLMLVADRYSRSTGGKPYYCRDALNNVNQYAVAHYGQAYSFQVGDANKAGVRPLFAIG